MMVFNNVVLYFNTVCSVHMESHVGSLGVHWWTDPLQWNQSNCTTSAPPQWWEAQQTNESCLLRWNV